MNEPTGVESSPGRTWPVLFGYTNNPSRPVFDSFGGLELSPSKVSLSREGKNANTSVIQAVMMVPIMLVVIVGGMAGRASGMHPLVIALVCGVVCGVLVGLLTFILGLVGALIQRLRKAKAVAEPPVLFDISGASVVYRRQGGIATIKRPDGQWVTVRLNPAKCPRPRKQARKDFEAELSRTFGSRFQVQ